MRVWKAVVYPLVLLVVPASTGLALWRIRPPEDAAYCLAFGAFLAVPIELVGLSLFLRLRASRSLAPSRSAAELAGTLAIAVSLASVVSALLWPATVAEWLLFSWKSAILLLLCVAGMIGAAFGKGSVRVTALLAGVATLAFWYALGTSG